MSDVVTVQGAFTPSRSALRTQYKVLWALMMHDIKSRYFGSGIGYAVTAIWPFAHIAIYLIIFIVMGRLAPYGDSKLLYVATGVYPFIVWNYVGRFTMRGASMNKSYLQYPIIKPLDLIFARMLLETNTMFIVAVLLVIVLSFSGADIVPVQPLLCLESIAGALMLGIGFGMFGAVICFIYPLFDILYIVIVIGFYASSGAAVLNPEFLPQQIGDLFAWNPVLHAVELMRLAYYPDFPTRLLDRSYLFTCGFVSFALGLVMERVLQRYIRATR